MMLFSDLKALSRTDHAELRLVPLPGYGFARAVTEVPVHGYELQWLVPVLPLAFRVEADSAALVGITGVHAGENLFVSPKGGWTGVTKPEALETYPFTMRHSRQGKGVLCVDRASDLLSYDEGEPLLTDSGEPSETLDSYQEPLQKQLRDRIQADRAIRALWEAGVLAPWETEDVETVDADVHYHAKLPALAALDPEKQAELARQGALALAYGQAHSMANMRKLRRMSQRQQRSSGIEGLLQSDDEVKLDFSHL